LGLKRKDILNSLDDIVIVGMRFNYLFFFVFCFLLFIYVLFFAIMT